jgi:O-antigen/teichoic acid export membrane protein
LLSVSEYAAYITLVAGLELTIVVAGIGLPWIEARYIPEFRINASTAILIRFITQLLQFQIGIFLLVAVSAWFSLDWVLSNAEMSVYQEAAQLYVFMLVVDGSGRRLRDGILSVLLQQKLAQISLVARNLVFIIGVLILELHAEVNLVYVIVAELLASLIGLLVSLLGLWRYLKQQDTKSRLDWSEPSWSEMLVVARNMYFSEMVAQAYSAQIFTFIIRYYLGVEATAIFGFLRNLYLQVRNYLPATLLFGLIRPKLVASYVGDGGIADLTRNSNMVGKLSLFVLMPLIVFSCLTGEDLITQLSGGKFPHTGYYFAGLMCSLIPVSQRQILETVAMVTGNSYLCNYAALLGVLTLPVTYGLIQIGFDLWAPIIATMLGNVIFCSTIVRGVAKKTLYQADMAGYYKMLLAAVIGYLGCVLVLFPAHGWVWLIAIATLTCCAFLLAAAIIKPFSNHERLRINQLIKHNLFIW